MKPNNKKNIKQRKEKRFHSITEVEKEFLPVSTARKEREKQVAGIEKRSGSRHMLSISPSSLE